jgi:hypothetical protein
VVPVVEVERWKVGWKVLTSDRGLQMSTGSEERFQNGPSEERELFIALHEANDGVHGPLAEGWTWLSARRASTSSLPAFRATKNSLSAHGRF